VLGNRELTSGHTHAHTHTHTHTRAVEPTGSELPSISSRHTHTHQTHTRKLVFSKQEARGGYAQVFVSNSASFVSICVCGDKSGTIGTSSLLSCCILGKAKGDRINPLSRLLRWIPRGPGSGFTWLHGPECVCDLKYHVNGNKVLFC